MITISDRGYWIIGFIVITGIVGQWLGQPWSPVAAKLWTFPTALLVAAVFAGLDRERLAVR